MIDYKLIYELYNCKGLGRVKINSIITQFFAETNLSKEDINLKILNFIKSNYDSILDFEKFEEDVYEIEKKTNQKVCFVDFTSDIYPKSLNLLASNKPTLLSCIGNLELLKYNTIGFCGSRKATIKGHQVAKDISEQVSNRKISVVSGYASGIDLEAHYTSLKNDGSTIIVLPEGLKNFKIKKILKEVWDWDKVLVISEYQPNAIWSVNRAMERNSTIVALSQIMVLIEAKIKGGSIDAGLKTLKFNKALFAPVYEGMPEEASGNKYLLERGAHPLKRKKETLKANLDRMFEIFAAYDNNFNKTLFD